MPCTRLRAPPDPTGGCLRRPRHRQDGLSNRRRERSRASAAAVERLARSFGCCFRLTLETVMSQVSIHKQQTTRRKPIECAPEPKMSKVNNLPTNKRGGAGSVTVSQSVSSRSPRSLSESRSRFTGQGEQKAIVKQKEGEQKSRTPSEHQA